MSLNIQLEKDTYYPGEKVKGVLSIIVPKPMRARKVQITFEGKEYTRVERFGRIAGMDIPHAKSLEPHVRVYKEEECIVLETINVWVAPKENYLGPCNEQFPFEFHLPEHALPSVITRGENGISYEIKAAIDRPRALDPKAYQAVQVFPRAYETYPTEPIKRSREDFEGKMQLIVSVAKDVFVPGERVTGKVVFRQDPSLQVQSVDIGLVCTGSFTAEGVTDTFEDMGEVIHCEINPSVQWYEWPFDIKTLEGAKFSLHGKLIQRSWKVEVRVNLPRKKNKIVDVPLLFVPLRTPATPDQ